MNEGLKKYLYDVKTSIEYIHEYLGARRSFSKYQSDRKLRRAVERELEIIGEAMNNLLKIEPDIAITAARKIVGLRNRIIHAYDAVDDPMVWDIVINLLPFLAEEVEGLLKE
jgi:uncharacterized protein with HEPN domain